MEERLDSVEEHLNMLDKDVRSLKISMKNINLTLENEIKKYEMLGLKVSWLDGEVRKIKVEIGMA